MTWGYKHVGGGVTFQHQIRYLFYSYTAESDSKSPFSYAKLDGDIMFSTMIWGGLYLTFSISFEVRGLYK